MNSQPELIRGMCAIVPRRPTASTGRGRLSAAVAATILTLLAAAPSAVRAQSVKVGLLPSTSMVAPGATFDLSIEVTEAGSPFNAFDIYLGFDPAALTPVPLSPISLQEGSYFTAACPNRFHRFKAGTDRDTISDVLLCAATSLTGPGQIYRVRFQASSTPQVTTVKFLPGLQFYNEGVFVNPAYSGSAIVWIGTPLAVPEAPGARDLRLSAAPNPARGAMVFELAIPEAGTASLEVADIQGRVVRKIEAGVLGPGAHALAWDGRDATGLTVAPGIYMARARVGSRAVHARFVRTR